MIKKIRTQDLQVGMYVCDFNAPWVQHPFLTSKKRLRTTREIQIILEHGIAEVYVDTARGADSPKAYAPEETDRPLGEELGGKLAQEGAALDLGEAEPPADESPFEEELRKARTIYDEAQGLIRGLFRDARVGRSVDGEGARGTVEAMIASVFRNRDALLSLARIKSLDQYTFQHSVNVAVLGLSLGSHLGILHRELLHLGVGALLHDLGKVHVPEAILQKRGPLTAEEFEVVKRHPAHGARLLLAAPAVPDEAAPVALNHHERYDGSGYPRALAGMEAGKLGLITAITDSYDAMTTDRVYQSGMPPHQALQRCYAWAGSHYHPLYVQKFIQCLGIYPVGTPVVLDTGEAGLVYRQHRGHLLQPAVRVVRSAAGHLLPDPVDVDLREPDPAGEKPFARSIERVVDARGLGVDLEAVLALPPRDAAGSGPIRVVVGQ